MMLLEKQIEQKILDKLEPSLSSLNVALISSWKPAQEGNVKGEELIDKDALVSLYIQPRQHDDFSLPMVTMNGTLVIDARVERCPTMSEVSPIYDAVITQMDTWHYNSSQFYADVSLSNFYAAEIKLNGGNNITLNENTNTWQVVMTFSLRGTQIF